SPSHSPTSHLLGHLVLLVVSSLTFVLFFFFFHSTSTTYFYTLSLHDALPISSTTSIDIMGLQAAYANLHTDQERDYFMQRYHDVISSFGGKTSYEADNRPLLVMRSNLWASGYDRSEERFSRNAETDLVCRLLL